MTDEQFNTLSQWEDNFRTAIRSKWARHPGQSAMHTIHRIYSDLSKTNQRLNTGCQSCVLKLLTDAGKLYFAEKEKRAEIAALTPAMDNSTKKSSKPRKSKSKA